MTRNQKIALAATAALAAVLVVLQLRHGERYPSTDDAYVDADVVQVVAQAAGPIVSLPIVDNQEVKAGDLLFEIDPRPFQIGVDRARAAVETTGQNVNALSDQVESAEARVAQARAALQLAEVQWRRIEPLANVGAVPYQDRDRAVANLDSARSSLADAMAQRTKAQHELGEAGEGNAELKAAFAELENAELQLGYTRVVASVNGFVTDLTLSLGSYANVGSPMLALVNRDSWRVTAYMKETELRHVRPGQRARVYLPAYPDAVLDGSVQGIGWGVEQQDGAGARGSEGMPTVSPTVDWVRMAQRFPVHITLAGTDPSRPLRKGMRASVRIDAAAD